MLPANPVLDENQGLLSALQREEREASMLRSLGNCLGVEFTPKSLPLPGGGVMEIDGFSAKANTVCEVCAADGELSEDEAEMLMLNTLKMRYAAHTLGNTVRRILLFRNERTALDFCGRSIVQQAMGDDMSLEVCVLSGAAALA
ncbi:hypothetical protein F183_A14650 [Bryobacterales bacterium F-183]|nr:hypothetical protein F183_A14650 [Bryobacterales bacterium F-183]